ncbi:MAG: YihY/virulence factor BrkB family protein, partial [Dehalococcoidia bacterium]|nr:YihY/virulence factor BrkB family protein [Dehalococcoidia bacterium]
PFFQERLMEFLMMVGFGALMLMSLGLTTAFKIVRQIELPVFGQSFIDGNLLWQAAVITISVFVSFLAFLFIYKLIPNTDVRWRHAALGALVAAVFFEMLKNLFIWFVADSASYRVIYGYVGTIIALMTWAYLSSVILLFCAKLTSTYPKVKATLAAEALQQETAREKLIKLTPAASMFIINLSSMTSGGVGALRRLMLGKG